MTSGYLVAGDADAKHVILACELAFVLLALLLLGADDGDAGTVLVALAAVLILLLPSLHSDRHS